MNKTSLSLGHLALESDHAPTFYWVYISHTHTSLSQRSEVALTKAIARGTGNSILRAAYAFEHESVLRRVPGPVLIPDTNEAAQQVFNHVTLLHKSGTVGNRYLFADYNAGGVVTFDDLMRIADKHARAQLMKMRHDEGRGGHALAAAPPRPRPPRPAPHRTAPHRCHATPEN